MSRTPVPNRDAVRLRALGSPQGLALPSRLPGAALAGRAAPPRRIEVLADPAAAAVGRGRPAAARRSATSHGPPRRPVRVLAALAPGTGRTPGAAAVTVRRARAGREGIAPAWPVRCGNIWVTHASSLVWMSQSGRG